MVRAKFTVKSCTPCPDGKGGVVCLHPVFDGSEENKQFFKWTPGGKIELSTINESAYGQFVEGGEFYVDFTPAK